MTPENFCCATCGERLQFAGERSDGKYYKCPRCNHLWPEYSFPTDLKAYAERKEVREWLKKRDRTVNP